MAIFTRAEKQQHLEAWKAALIAVSQGQEYTIGTRRLRRADLPAIQAHLDWLDGQSTVEDQAAGCGSPAFISLIPGRYS